MKNIIRNFRRIFSDDGRDDKRFAEQERRLREAQQYLHEATDGLTKAAGILADLIKRRA